ncbi:MULTISPECIES: Holliday junction resolvase RuvX [Rickettsieae]|jgi:putative holliday junction resolvase|uniref:Holliday junction resolvase RuvX n=1 Tax=Rickettsieae TaxID=33988 RepID=UPI000B9B0B64|nr:MULTISPECIES: Holliday junction resolvase RuvX [unclassified Rickettsia]MDN3030206.1 Holliday junction resolvase RuvX [Candidatus Tisiphia sp.]OZG31753.1 crossover junction endodeoxyribonuclease RuvA [Rickettsia endosymbiont of Culicoides newsteadi]
MIIAVLQEFFQLLQANRPIIAIDYGIRKTGIAISNQEQTIAMPLKTIYETIEEKKIKSILDLVATYSICGIVIGLPISMNGNSSEQTIIVLKFSATLSSATNLPIYLQDERLTSLAANNLLKSLGVKRRERNQKDDSIAASMILETTLDSIKKLQ